MKILLLALLAASSVMADEIKTLRGKIYKGDIARAEPDGLVMMTDDGIEKIPFMELPKEIREKYGFDPARAEAFAAAVAAGRAKLGHEMNAAQIAELERRMALDASTAKAKASIAEARPAARSNPLESGPATASIGIHGVIFQKTEKGLIVDIAKKSAEEAKLIYVYGYPKFDTAADNEKINGSVTLAGTHQYKNVEGAMTTLKAYDWSK